MDSPKAALYTICYCTSSGFRTESDRNFRAAFRAAGFLAARAAGFFFKSVPHSRPPSSRFSSRFSSRRLNLFRTSKKLVSLSQAPVPGFRHRCLVSGLTLTSPCRDAEFTFPGLYLNPERKIMADAGRHQAGKIIASQSLINLQRT